MVNKKQHAAAFNHKDLKLLLKIVCTISDRLIHLISEAQHSSSSVAYSQSSRSEKRIACPMKTLMENKEQRKIWAEI